MTPRKIRRLKRMIAHPDYLEVRTFLMRTESVLWWREFKETNDPKALKTALVFCRKENWYIRRASK